MFGLILEHLYAACGVFGAIAYRDVVPAVVSGLRRVEYRGYDSAGIAVLNGHIERVRTEGRVKDLEDALKKVCLSGTLAIGHTRWATHGGVSEANAHPHMSRNEIVLVHNGVIENHKELRQELDALGYQFESQTDTEVVAHLVHYYAQKSDFLDAVRQAVKRLQGAYALVICSLRDKNKMIAVRKGSPLLVGLGKDGNFAASDGVAVVHETRHVKYLEEGDVAVIGHTNVTIYASNGQVVERKTHVLDLSAHAATKGQYDHFMQKEIHEQPKALLDTLEQVLRGGVSPGLFGDTEGVLAQANSVRFLACGTSSYAGRVAQQWIEEIAGIPANSEIASEYRYRKSIPNSRELVVTISQSGETADTAEALRRAKELGHDLTLSICNVRESTIPRESRLVFYTRAGAEIGVASTKAFTTQLAALFILSLTLAKVKGRLPPEKEREYLEMLRKIPGSVQHALNLEPQIRGWAKNFAHKEHALFLGRGVHHPVALEGALKLKEITYIHAEAYPAGELKHGPLALVDQRMPVVVIAPNDELFGKIESNISEVRARKAQLYVFTDEGSTYEESDGIHVIRLPRHDGILSPIMHVLPVQLLAYHTAVLMKRDIDNPRNLAKSVTVE